MGRTLLALVLMLAGPPAVLLLWAHLLRPVWHGSDWIAPVAAGLLGLAGVVTAPWSNRVLAVVAIAYILLCVVALRYLTLAAVCTTGDCL